MPNGLNAPQIVVRGNPIDGFTYWGPFADYSDASEFTESGEFAEHSDWWIVKLQNPATD